METDGGTIASVDIPEATVPPWMPHGKHQRQTEMEIVDEANENEDLDEDLDEEKEEDNKPSRQNGRNANDANMAAVMGKSKIMCPMIPSMMTIVQCQL
eukprot:15328926-Ditylum_brightwellii.AAC.1